MTVDVYAVGIVHASVCAPKNMPIDDLLDHVNMEAPTGLDWGWRIDLTENFRTGQTNPCPCDRDPDTRIHRLLSC